MGRVPRSPVDPESPESIAQQQRDVIETIDNKIEFGEPLDPRDPESVILAGSGTPTVHNGIRSNILGSWVELEINGAVKNTLADPIMCHHNLYQEQPDTYTTEPVAGEPNCRWFVVGWQHDGTTRPFWDDAQVVLGTGHLAGASDPIWTAYKGGEVLLFNKNQDNIMYFTVQLSHKYKHETNLHFHVHMIPVDDVAQNECRWVLTYSWADINQDFPGQTTTTTNQTVAANSADRHTYFVVDGAVSSASAENNVSSVLICSIMREGTDPADDLDTDVYLAALDFHYQIDSPGSVNQTSKPGINYLQQSPVQAYFRTGDTITANEIQLRFAADPFMLVDNSHPLKVTLFFIKATR